jgi:hypothetical protein
MQMTAAAYISTGKPCVTLDEQTCGSSHETPLASPEGRTTKVACPLSGPVRPTQPRLCACDAGLCVLALSADTNCSSCTYDCGCIASHAGILVAWLPLGLCADVSKACRTAHMVACRLRSRDSA